MNRIKIEIPKYILEILEALESNEFEAYVVGGCVRDSLLCRTPQDWDVTTNATPDEVKICLSRYRILETGIKHGTVTVVSDGKQTEITTFRVDGGYSNFRHPDSVSFTGELKADLSRRDFTINALAYNPKRGLFDFFGGVKDLQKRKIRCVGDARKRFSEDALRILRAARFASTLGFNIGQATSEAMDALAYLLDKISPERISSELCKILTGSGVSKILLEYPRIFAGIIPELEPLFDFPQHTKYHHLDVWLHTVEAVRAVPCDLVLRLVMLLHDCGKPICFTFDEDGSGHFYGHAGVSAALADAALSRLRLDNATRLEVVYLIKHHCDLIHPEQRHLKRLLNKMGEERVRRMIAVKRADCAAQAPEYRREREKYLNEAEAALDDVIMQNQAFSLKGLAVNGDDLIDVGFEKGKTIGDALNILLELVIDDKVKNDRETLLSYAERLLRKQ